MIILGLIIFVILALLTAAYFLKAAAEIADREVCRRDRRPSNTAHLQ